VQEEGAGKPLADYSYPPFKVRLTSAKVLEGRAPNCKLGLASRLNKVVQSVAKAIGEGAPSVQRAEVV
jgi:hypothetical protein